MLRSRRSHPFRSLRTRLLHGTIAVSLVVLARPATLIAQESDPGTEPGGIGIALAEAPVDRADDPRAQRYVVDHLQPGDSIDRRIRVQNTAATATTAELYVGAAEVRDGRFTPADGRTGNELSEWSSLADTVLALDPGETIETTVRLVVPSDATPGERYGVIWAQPPPDTGGGVTVINRVGIRIYLSIGGPEPPIDFAIREAPPATAANGIRAVCVTAENLGGRAVDLSGSVTVTDDAGRALGPYALLGAPVLAIGQLLDVCAALPAETGPGPWTATVAVEGGPIERSISFPVTFPPPDESLDLAPPVVAGSPTTSGTADGLILPDTAEAGEAAGDSDIERIAPFVAGALVIAVGTAALLSSSRSSPKGRRRRQSSP